ncbi:Hypothetical predicted protein [Cloeon dipterum]|uniref:C2H2-type domain-containing protein n=1 Tax=Cloeon dipterum TaxID=197152 RepID=A0A8S1E5K6_9INSE|nr:Hypothetical predicted protein [Cloeon dipterum]
MPIIKAKPKTQIQPKVNGKYACQFCPRQYLSRTSRWTHQRCCSQNPNVDAAALPKPKKQKTSKVGGYVCQFCAREYKSRVSRWCHQRRCPLNPNPAPPQPKKQPKRKVSVTCELCGKTLAKASMQEHLKIMHDIGTRTSVCHICGKSFSYNSALLVHLSRHDVDGRRWQCDICGLTAVVKSELERHILVSHLKKKQFVCAQCGKRFGYLSSLKKHTSAMHSAVKPTKRCDVCGKQVLPWRMGEHMQLHGQTKLHTCRVCGLSYKRLGPLVQHLDNAHGQYINACELCDMSFSKKGDLRVHKFNEHNIGK